MLIWLLDRFQYGIKGLITREGSNPSLSQQLCSSRRFRLGPGANPSILHDPNEYMLPNASATDATYKG